MNVPTSNPSNQPAVSHRAFERWMGCVMILGVTVLPGCLNPNFTRLPSWNPQYPAAENAAYGRQDPFPDPDIGPATDSSPRGYERPRSEARQAAEQRLFQGLPIGPEGVLPGVPQGTNNSQAVY